MNELDSAEEMVKIAAIEIIIEGNLNRFPV